MNQLLKNRIIRIAELFQVISCDARDGSGLDQYQTLESNLKKISIYKRKIENDLKDIESYLALIEKEKEEVDPYKPITECPICSTCACNGSQGKGCYPSSRNTCPDWRKK